MKHSLILPSITRGCEHLQRAFINQLSLHVFRLFRARRRKFARSASSPRGQQGKSRGTDPCQCILASRKQGGVASFSVPRCNLALGTCGHEGLEKCTAFGAIEISHRPISPLFLGSVFVDAPHVFGLDVHRDQPWSTITNPQQGRSAFGKAHKRWGKHPETK